MITLVVVVTLTLISYDAEEFVILAAEGFRGESLLLQAAADIWDSQDGVCKACGERRNRKSTRAVCGPFSSFFRALASCLVLQINIRTFDTPPSNHHPLHSLILHRWSTGACRTPRETSHE